jgi:hypothetical protein
MKQTINEMDKFTILRWNALMEGVNMILDKAEDNGIAPEDVTLKQNHLIRYVDETTERIRAV